MDWDDAELIAQVVITRVPRALIDGESGEGSKGQERRQQRQWLTIDEGKALEAEDAALRHAERLRHIAGGTDCLLPQDVDFDVEAPGPHALAEGGEGRDPLDVRSSPHEGPLSADTVEAPLSDQVQDSLANWRERDPIAVSQFSLGRQGLSGSDVSPFNHAEQKVPELNVEGCRRVAADRPGNLRGIPDAGPAFRVHVRSLRPVRPHPPLYLYILPTQRHPS